MRDLWVETRVHACTAIKVIVQIVKNCPAIEEEDQQSHRCLQQEVYPEKQESHPDRQCKTLGD